MDEPGPAEDKAGAAAARPPEFYSTLLDNVADSVHVLDAEGKFIYVNAAACRSSGYTREELLGKSIAVLNPPGEAALVPWRIKQILAGGEARFEVTHVRKDGGTYPVEAHARVIELGGERVIAAIDRDVTADKRLQRELAASEARYRTIYQGSMDALLLFSPERGFFDANPAALALLRCTREEFLKMTPDDFSPERQPDGALSAARTREIIALAMAKGGHFFEWRLKRRDGEEFDAAVLLTRLTLDGRPVLYATVRDVTEARRTADENRDNLEIQEAVNRMLHRSLEPLPLPNKLAEYLKDILKVSWLSIEGKGAIFLLEGGALRMAASHNISPELLAKCARVPLGRCLCGKAAATGKAVVTASVGPDHDIRYDGMAGHGHYCAPIMAGGETLGVLNLYLKAGCPLPAKHEAFLKAATDVLAASVVRSRVEGQLLQSQKMESVGRLAGGVAHDFNNILTAVKFYAELLRKGLPHGDQKRDDASEILAAAERAVSLTRQLLAFSRRQVMVTRVVDLNVVTADMLNMLRRLIGEHIELKTDLADEPCTVKVDPGQLEQVIMNLAVNARDAMPDGGSITIETEVVGGTDALYREHPELPRGRLVRLAFCDNGCGMPPEVLEHIFEPFFTTKEQGKGTGLGLSTVFGIVKQSGGEVEVSSAPGKGTNFVIYLAHTAEACAEQKEAAGKCAPRPAAGETVLLVEDEDSLRRVGERVLAAAGYSVIAVPGGAAALKALQARGAPVNLLVTDVVMPGLGGRDLAREAQRLGLVRRVLYMSGYSDDIIMSGGALEEGLAFIYKPFSADALLKKVREVLDGTEDKAKA